MAGDNRERAEIDLLIRKLAPVKPVRQGPVAAIGSNPPSVLRYVHVPRRPWAVRGCVALGVALGIALPFWPYPRGCGWGLDFYLASIALIFIAGVWGARLTWDTRLGFTHVVALTTTLWGFVLTAQEILPRVGYAQTHAPWLCQ